jgi:hypothetical protein
MITFLMRMSTLPFLRWKTRQISITQVGRQAEKYLIT